MENMKISIIIPTYNEETSIEECVNSLKNQSLKNFEIILVDDGSCDNTKQILNRIQSTSHNIRVFSQVHKGPALARNLGASRAKGSILVFVDADMTFDKNFLLNLTKPILNKKTKGTFSKEEYVSNWNNIWAKSWNINENWEAKKRHPKNFPDTQKVFRAILKSEFVKAGGFDAGGYTDDYTLSEKLGYKAAVAPKAKFYHKNPDSLKEVFFQSKWAAKRRYKAGVIGLILVLFLKLSLPATLAVAVYKTIRHNTPAFFVFKFVYNSGATLGIIEYYLFKKGAK